MGLENIFGISLINSLHLLEASSQGGGSVGKESSLPPVVLPKGKLAPL